MAIVLGLAAALTYGVADFIGGFVTRRADVFTVVLLSQTIGSSLMLAALPWFLNDAATGQALGFGAAAGIGGATGVILLYRGLATGRMSVVAPITAVEAASVPVVFGLSTGERPSEAALAGVAIALVAVALVSSASDPNDAGDLPGQRWAGVPEALGAGLGFGAFFILLNEGGAETGLWPLVAARTSSLVLVGGAALLTRRPLRPPAGTGRGIAAAGVLDVTANLCYLLATRRGLLSIVAVLTSMYPASTVILARAVLHERFRPSQVAGLACAVVGIALIALG